MNDWNGLTPQDEQGRWRLDCIYQNALEAFSQYPQLHKHAATEDWLKTVYKLNLAKTDCLVQLTYPLLYLIPQYINEGVMTSDYLNRIECGLQLVIDKATRFNRNDVIGKLTTPEVESALFELLLIAALVQQFGQDAIEPYPKIGDGKKTLDIAIVRDGVPRLLVEAVAIKDDDESAKDQELRRQGKIMRYSGLRNPSWDMGRVVQKVIGKARQRQPNAPFVLCVCQYTTWPARDDVPEILNRTENAEGGLNSMLVGCFYFHYDKLVGSRLLHARAKKHGIPLNLLSECRDAFNT